MRHSVPISPSRSRFAASTLLLVCAPDAASAEVIDRIVATVNGHVILQTDWDEALCYEALLTNRTLAQFTDDDRRAVLDRLIDQELLREQMKSADFRHATDTEVAARVADARKQYPQAASGEAWQALLARLPPHGKGSSRPRPAADRRDATGRCPPSPRRRRSIPSPSKRTTAISSSPS